MKHTKTFVVESENGLHARPACELVRIATAFKADIMFSSKGKSVNAKSLLAILLLCVGNGAEFTATADGADAADALLAIGHASCLLS
jgi:phosphocarrier protein HPr